MPTHFKVLIPYIRMLTDFKDDILSGRKRTTVRLGIKKFTVGDSKVRFSDGTEIFVIVRSIHLMSFIDMKWHVRERNPKLYKSDSELLEALHKCYLGVDLTSKMYTVVDFEVKK